MSVKLTKEEQQKEYNQASEIVIKNLKLGGLIYYQKVGYTSSNKVINFLLIKDNKPMNINYYMKVLFKSKYFTQQKDTGCIITDDTTLSSIKYHFNGKLNLDEKIQYIFEV